MVVAGVGQPGSMAPVMSILAAAQQDIMELSGNNLKDKLKRFDKVPNVGKGHVYHAPGGHARARPTEWGILAWNRNFICLSSVALEFRKLRQTVYREAPASTTNIEQGSKIYVAFLGLPQLIRSL